MRGRLALGVVLTALSGAAGCDSAHIKDVYIARDDSGRRRTNCVRPEYLNASGQPTPGHYFVFVEMLSFKDDTIMTPVVRCLSDCEKVPGGPDRFADGELVPVAWQDDELLEFGNMAPGKGDFTISWEITGPPQGGSTTQNLPLHAGLFEWEFYLNDHRFPDETEQLLVSPKCD